MEWQCSAREENATIGSTLTIKSECQETTDHNIAKHLIDTVLQNLNINH